jgi:hypothetical protein
MRRPLLALTLSIGIGLVLAACASPAGSPGQSAGSEPSEAGAQSEAPAASQGEGGGGGGGEGEGGAPALADGPWTGGQGQTTTSGAVSHTTDAPISTDVSSTEDAKTLLAYNTDDTFVTIFINLTGVPFQASVDAPDFSASGEDCDVTYARADDTGIDATFRCVVDEFYYFGDPEPTGEIIIEGSFTATR